MTTKEIYKNRSKKKFHAEIENMQKKKRKKEKNLLSCAQKLIEFFKVFIE